MKLLAESYVEVQLSMLWVKISCQYENLMQEESMSIVNYQEYKIIKTSLVKLLYMQ